MAKNSNNSSNKHSHHFVVTSKSGESATLKVIILTGAMMVIEIASGMLFGSMALLADGWHMGTHAAALGITLFTYHFAKKHMDNPEYSFGPGKVGSLGGFASAIILAVVAFMMMFESAERFINPVQIHFYEAIVVAVIGLIVNVVSIFWLGDHDHHGHGHSHNHDHSHNHKHDHDHSCCDHHEHEHHSHSHHSHDHNLKAAYAHVLADAFTSVLAIIALIAGKIFGFWWLDPVIGIVGAIVILKWAAGLLKETSGVLLDRSHDQNTAVGKIEQAIQENSGDEVADIHLWRLSPAHYALMATIETENLKCASEYKQIVLDVNPNIGHITIEVVDVSSS